MAKTPRTGVLRHAALIASAATGLISSGALTAKTASAANPVFATPSSVPPPPILDRPPVQTYPAKSPQSAPVVKTAPMARTTPTVRSAPTLRSAPTVRSTPVVRTAPAGLRPPTQVRTNTLTQPAASIPPPASTPVSTAARPAARPVPQVTPLPKPMVRPIVRPIVKPVEPPPPPDSESPSDSEPPKKLKYGYEGIFDAVFAGHLHEPQDLASQKLNFQFEQNASYGSKWKGALGVSAWNESSFATVPARYSGSVIQDDSRDLRLRNAYVQYRSDNLFIRVGNQQVVWGEAFGFFYSDIVNPKDLRYGLFGDFTQIRLQTPMVNTKLTFADLALQAIFIPKPYFNILPSPGNDFAFPYQSVTGIPTSIIRETTRSISASSMEAGARVSYLFDRLDMSAFFFNYIDRDPWYSISPTSQVPTSLVLEEHHSRVQSYGLTATDDFGGFIFRVEALTTRNRTLPVVVNTPFGSSLGTTQLDDYIYVIGMDVPTWEKWNLGFQWSQDILSRNYPGLFRNQVVSLASIRLQRPTIKNQSAELMYTYSLRDAGQRAEFNYMIPISGKIETSVGINVLGGPPSSSFGSIYEATRAYILFKYFLKAQG